MAFSTVFKNLGHYFATGFKYVAVGIKDVVLVANKAQPLQPEVDMLVGALAGPLGVKVSDTAFHILGDVAAALQPLQADAIAQQTAVGLNLTLDAQTVNDIKALAKVIDAIIKSVGGTTPTAAGAAVIKPAA